MRRPSLHVVVAIALSGCALPLASPPAAGPGAGATTGAAAPGRAAAGQPPEPLGGLSFKVLAPENARYAGGVGGAVPAGTAAMAPMPAASAPAPSGAPMPGGYSGPPAPPEGLNSGNMNGGYGYAYGYGPGFFGGEPTTLVSLTQSETAGSKGPYRQILEAVIQPVLADWAADASLMTNNATTDGAGLLVAPSPAPSTLPAGCAPIYGGSPNDTGWRLSYLSASRREMLSFFVTPEKTLVVRARWAPLNLAATPIAVDNDAAVRSLTAAIETKGFKGEEEKTGLDYFMGGPFAQTCFGAVPMPQPLPLAAGPGDAPPENRNEVIFDVPADVRWQTNLQVILGKPVWELSFYAPPRPVSATDPNGEPTYEDPGFYLNNSARGLVDATTGAVIRFSRPNKQYYPRSMKRPYPIPMASAPAPDASPPPAPAATPSPTTSAPPPGPNDTPPPVPVASAPAP